MQRRLLIIALVFVAGFGVGYGITWLLVGSPRKEPEASRAAQATTAPTTAPAHSAPPPATAPAADAQTPETRADAPDAQAVDAGPAARGDAAGPGPEVAPAAADADAGTGAVPEKAAWEACHLHACRLDFGKVSGGISVRKGSLEHGQKVDWDRDFAKADKVGTLEAGKNVEVEVLAIGLADGEPAAAYIVRKTKRDELKGVIALRIGDKQLRLVPISE